MKTIQTTGYQGGDIHIVASKIVAFQHRKNVGDMTELGISKHPQTTVWIACGTETETWIILESVADFARKVMEAKE